MNLRWGEQPDWFDTAALQSVTKIFDVVHADAIVSPGDGYLGSDALSGSSDDAYVIKYVSIIDNNNFGFGERLFVDTLPGAEKILLAAVDESGTIQCCVTLRTDGRLSIWHGDMDTLLGTSADPVSTGVQMRLGFAGYTSKSSGWAEVTVNEVPVVRVDEVNTAFSDAVAWKGVYIGLTADLFVSHMYACDAEGDLPSDLLVDVRYGDVAGAYQEWTPNAGTQVTAIDDASPDGDTSIITSSAVGARWTNGMAATTERVAVYGTQATAVARNYIASGSASFRHVLIADGQIFVADWQSVVQEEWRALTLFYEKNPRTEQPWKSSELNVIERGGETEY